MSGSPAKGWIRRGSNRLQERAERGQPLRRRAEERCVEVSDGTEHRPGLLRGDDGLPAEHGVAEVAHDQHAEPFVVVPAVHDRMQHRGRQAVEDAPLEEVHLAAVGVAGEPHDQVDGGVEALDHDPGPVGEEYALQRRARAAVVIDRCAVEGGVEHRRIHGSIMLAWPGWRSAGVHHCDTGPVPVQASVSAISRTSSGDLQLSSSVVTPVSSHAATRSLT